MTILSMSSAAQALPRALSNLEHILRKGEVNAIERGIDPQIFMDTRLTPDMWPLKKQAQTVCELAKNAPYRVAGTTPPDYQTVVETFEDSYALIAKAKADGATRDGVYGDFISVGFHATKHLFPFCDGL